jgi:hypothetical protein
MKQLKRFCSQTEFVFKQVTIKGIVGDHKSRNAPGLDDISFRNHTCDQDHVIIHSTGMSTKELGLKFRLES